MHPSGYAVYYSESALENLKHESGGAKQFGASRSRRGKFFDRCSALYFFHRKLHLWTFTVPELQTDYENTDKYFASRFSMLLENYRKRQLIKSYVYVTEAQERGNIHFHLVTNNQFIPVKEVNDYWCKLINQPSKNAVDLQIINNKSVNKVPAYLAKYMSKTMQGKAYKNANRLELDKNMKGRIIYARSFNSSRDLNKWHPIKINQHELPKHLPHKAVEKVLEITQLDKSTGELTKRKILKTEYYFNSLDVINYYGGAFIERKQLSGASLG